MSGHSKWHNIQAKKGKADAARGAVFTKSAAKSPLPFATAAPTLSPTASCAT